MLLVWPCNSEKLASILRDDHDGVWTGAIKPERRLLRDMTPFGRRDEGGDDAGRADGDGGAVDGMCSAWRMKRIAGGCARRGSDNGNALDDSSAITTTPMGTLM